MKLPPSFLAASVFLLAGGAALADVKLPALISDHMVLEKSEKVPIWGWAEPGEKVTVTLNGRSVRAEGGKDGKWMVALNLKDSAPGPFEMTVEGKNRLTVSDVVVGQVWLASGQSNMEFSLKNAFGAEQEFAAPANPMLRHFAVKNAASAEPLEDCQGEWVTASPKTVGDFSAVGYFFARKLQSEIQGPVGIINATWGGTPIEAWTSQPALLTVADLAAGVEQRAKTAREYPDAKKKFVADFGAWLKKTGREDKAPEAAAFAAPGISTEGWVAVQLPGEVAGEGLPANGAIWLRREIAISAGEANKPVSLNLGPIDGFESIYWNGEPVKATTFETFPGEGFVRRASVPAHLVKEGTNTLAIRIFAPVAAPRFPGTPRAGAKSFGGEWLAKAEFALPPLDDETAKAAPQPPSRPAMPQEMSSALFHGMINPLVPYAIKGIIWYQGENNADRAYQYRTAFPLMIEDWRGRWQQESLPFYFCQLANYLARKRGQFDIPAGREPEPAESTWAELREAQTQTLRLPETGQAILIDIGESRDIHPRNKKDAGERLALVALAKTYGKDLPYSGPVYESLAIEGNAARVKFRHADGGLVVRPEAKDPSVGNMASEVQGFAICGEDRKWVWADARIDGQTVIVWSDKVPAPVAVRYAWANDPACNLYNGAGLPAAPFRTDDFPGMTREKKF